MNDMSKKKRFRRRARPTISAMLRLLLGLSMVACSLLMPCIVILSQGGSWSDLLNIVGEIGSFFSNGTSAWLLAGYTVFLPVFGLYLMVEACLSFRPANTPISSLYHSD